MFYFKNKTTAERLTRLFVQTKICRAAIILLIFAVPVCAQKVEWTIKQYFENLPEKYKTYAGDYPKLPPKNAIVVDEENGYAAILNLSAGVSLTDPQPIFEMALFRREKGEPLIVVANVVSDSVCSVHETFFLEKRGDSWLDARARVLPKLSLPMFFRDTRLAARFRATNAKIGNPEKLDLHFAPPRTGTRMKVSLDICDYVPDELGETLSFDEFIENAQTVSLDWNKRRGIFELVK